MFPILWPIAAILYFHNRHDPYVKWISLFVFIGGGGSYFALMHIIIQPHLYTQGMLSDLENTILTISVIVFMAMFYFLIPYVFLMSSIALVKIKKRGLSWVLLLPSFFLFYLEWNTISQGVQLQKLHLWSGIYIIIGCLIYLQAFRTAKTKLEKRNALRLNIIFLPIILLIFLKDYLFVDQVILEKKDIFFEQNIHWTINSNYIDLWLLFLFFFYSVRYGILGIKLRIEKQRIDASMTSLAFGSAIMNHTIKNEIQKMEYMRERAKFYATQSNQVETIETIDKMGLVTNHLQQMVNHIKEKSEEIVLTEQTVNITNLIDGVLDGLQPLFEKKKITVVTEYEFYGSINCDTYHLRDTLSNLCMNAIEAMGNENGLLSIIVKPLRKQLQIQIKDTGKGVDSSNFSKVFEPFFTTKKGPTNYGLGLTYCYKVMKKHQGEIKIMESEKNRGTTIALIFPNKRIIGKQRSVTHGANQSLTS